MALWRRWFLVGLTPLVTCWAATIVFAWQHRHYAGLGTPLFPGPPPIYWPWAIVQWTWWWAGKRPELFYLTGGVGLAVLVLCLIRILRPDQRPPKPPEAKLGGIRELRKLGLLAKEGVVLGTYKGRTVRHNGPEHLLTAGPTRSGKTYSHVLPTLTDGWRESVVIHDPKLEIARKTIMYRRKFSRVVWLCPTSAQTDCYDPMKAIRLDTDDEFRDTQIVAQLLGDPDKDRIRGGEGEHFGEWGDQLRQGLVLHGLTTGRATTLPALTHMITGPQPFQDLLKEMMANPHPLVQHAAFNVRDIKGDELSGVLSNARRALTVFLDPRVAHMVSRSDFTLRDLRERQQPMSLYVSIPFADQDRLRPLSRLILSQIFQYATQRLGPWRHRLLMLTEEVAALGRFDTLHRALDYVAGFGITLCNITPNFNAMREYYGANHNFWAGSNIRLIFSPNNTSMAEMVMREIGDAVREKERTMVAHDPFRLIRDKTTISKEETLEPLLSVTALRQLPRNRVLLLHGDGTSFLLKKYHYKQRAA